MLSANSKITNRQLQMLLMLDAFGIGIVVLPGRAAAYASHNGWMVSAGLMGIALSIAFLLTSVTRLFPGLSFMEYTQRLLTKPVAWVMAAGLLLKLLFSAGLEMRLFSLLTQRFLLRDTPQAVVGALMVALAAYTAAKGIETRARVAEILFFIIIVPLALLLLFSLFDTDFTNLLPLSDARPGNILSGSLRLGYVFSGMECLLLAPFFISGTKKTRRSVLYAVLFTGVLILIITVMTLAKFGGAETQSQEWPVIRMMDMINLPGSFVERQDTMATSFWIISVYVATGMAVFYGAFLLNGMRGKTAPPAALPPILLCASFIYIVSVLPLPAERIFRLLDWTYYTFGVFYLFILPLVLLAAARLRMRLRGSRGAL